jgi:sugar/nucleoside kinase (ribokinase family)
MSVYLGAAVGLKKEEATLDDIKKSRFLYTSAYVLDSPELKKTVTHALHIAKESKVKIAFDLADKGVISRHKEEIKDILESYADIVFANETEAESFTGKKDPKDALIELSKICEIAVVKLGEGCRERWK